VAPTDAPLDDSLAMLDQRRALQLLSHRARTRRLCGHTVAKHSFVVLLDDRR
jgi:hypothetical protein